MRICLLLGDSQTLFHAFSRVSRFCKCMSFTKPTQSCVLLRYPGENIMRDFITIDFMIEMHVVTVKVRVHVQTVVMILYKVVP